MDRRLVAGVTAGALAVVGAVWLVRRRHSPTTNTSDAAAALAAQRVRHALELRRKLSGFDTFWMDESGFRITSVAPGVVEGTLQVTPGVQNFLGVTAAVRVMPVRLRGRWAGEYDTCARHSTLHGGATASALEAVGILATVAAGVSAARTVEMSVQYTAAATADAAVRVQGRMLAAAGGLVQCEGALYNTKGVVVAFGRITAQYSRPWAMRVMPRSLQGWMARRALRWLPLPCRADLSALPESPLPRDEPGKNLYFETFAQPDTPFVGFDRVFAAEADGLVRQPPAQDAAHAGVARYTVGHSRWLRGPCGTLHSACAAMLVDDLGTAALVGGGGGSGSSIVLTMTAVQQPPVDAGVQAVTRVLRGGRKLGFTVVDLVDSHTGRLYFTGNLLKYSR